jgi:hypothetical protein
VLHALQVNSDCDEFGNTALHMCVIHDQADMYDFLVDYCAASEAVRNHGGLTPLCLAAQIGKADMLQHIYNRRRRAFYSFGKVRVALGSSAGWNAFRICIRVCLAAQIGKVDMLQEHLQQEVARNVLLWQGNKCAGQQWYAFECAARPALARFVVSACLPLCAGYAQDPVLQRARRHVRVRQLSPALL